ncbi:MAG: PorT family protein [Chitinophagaceae bacterium]|nr:PorT family protein [Chitinophagaceae bacterium]
MLNVNDDMDELMRRAAENYPLKADSNNFDKVLEGIRSFKSEDELKEPDRSNKRLLWLLLLLPFTFICNKYYNNGGAEVVSKSGTPVETTKSTAPASAKPADFAKGTAAAYADKENAPVNNGRKKEGAHLGVRDTAELNGTDAGLSTKQAAANNRVIISTKTNRTQKQSEVNKSEDVVAAAQGKRPTAQQQGAETKTMVGDENDYTITNSKESSSNQNNIHPATQTKVTDRDTIVKDDPTLREVYQDEVKHLELSKVPDTSIQKTTTPVVVENKEAEMNKSRSKKVYVGIMGGPDLSTVKNNSITKVGYSFGILTGYKPGKKLSFETGLMWSKRFYKSEGKYFDTKKLPIPAYVKITELHGFCQMYELPLGATYDFKAGKKNTWFSALGFSTYFMKNEDYSYNYLAWGQPHTRYVSYDNSANNWFSILNVSIGVNKKIGKNALLRVQPYIKIPLKGIGIGSLPVSGTGLYAGFVKNIF